jgi:uncharacterized protein
MNPTEVNFPFTLDAGGQVASPSYDVHIYQLIEQLLFTSPGERVNRPDFGCGLLSTLFTSLSSEEVTAVEFLVQSALVRWLGTLIQVNRVQVSVPAPSTLLVTIQYVVLRDRTSFTSTFESSLPA